MQKNKMAKEFAKQFYNSAIWIRTSKAYAVSKFFICEKCGKPATRYIVHHKIQLTPENIRDPAVALDWKNLQLVCLRCHNAIHKARPGRTVIFSSDGQVIGVEYPPLTGQGISLRTSPGVSRYFYEKKGHGSCESQKIVTFRLKKQIQSFGDVT